MISYRAEPSFSNFKSYWSFSSQRLRSVVYEVSWGSGLRHAVQSAHKSNRWGLMNYQLQQIYHLICLSCYIFTYSTSLSLFLLAKWFHFKIVLSKFNYILLTCLFGYNPAIIMNCKIIDTNKSRLTFILLEGKTLVHHGA